MKKKKKKKKKKPASKQVHLVLRFRMFQFAVPTVRLSQVVRLVHRVPERESKR